MARGRLVVSVLVLGGLVGGLLAWQAPVVSAAPPDDGFDVQTDPPDGEAIDASGLAPLPSARPAGPVDRPGGAVPSLNAAPPVPSPVDEPFPVEDVLGDRFVEGQSVELVDERDAHTAVYANPDGSRTAMISEAPLHFEQAPGLWEQIDSSLVPVEGEPGVWRTAANSWEARFSATGVDISTPVSSVGFSFVADQPVEPVVDQSGGWVTYPDVWPGVDVVYVPGPAGVEELLVVKSRDVPASFEFALRGGRARSRTADGGVAVTSDVTVDGLVTFGADGRGIRPGVGPCASIRPGCRRCRVRRSR